MKFPRTSGLLLHPTSLPGGHGLGDLGGEARAFVEFLAQARLGVWQVLPLGPTGFGDSPYQCFSAFAGNPLLVSLEDLAEEGWLERDRLLGAPEFPVASCDFAAAIDFKLPLLRRAALNFERLATPAQRTAFEEFCRVQAGWLDDYALFAAAKAAHGGRPWHEWDVDLAEREPAALEAWRARTETARHAERFAQYAFFRQWRRLRELCFSHGVHVLGDLPIFVAHDSADVWAHPELFRLGKDGRPAVIAGVPPDYFSATGQCWGNPLYRWEALERSGYAWWIERVRQALQLYDWVRLDHFRGFEACWEIPGGDETAVNGRWVKGPGAAFFDALQAALGDVPIVAENLGLITPEVEALRQRFGMPGMAILQFAFGQDPDAPGFRPHNYPRELVAYTGTHDNDTSLGWWKSSGEGDSTRTPAETRAEKDFTRRYLKSDGREIHWDMIRALFGSVADVAIVPLQDVLGLGSEARMNLPARPVGNWGWRYAAGQLETLHATRLRELGELFDRAVPGGQRAEAERP